MRGDRVAATPAAEAFLRSGIPHREILRLEERDGGRPHRLDEYLAGGHEVDRLVEGGPEATELASLLEADQNRHQLVDLSLCHITLVDKGHVAIGLNCHCGIHQANRRVVDQGNLALQLRIDEDRPRILLAELVDVVAEGISVVVSWNAGQEVGRCLADLRAGRGVELAECRISLAGIAATLDERALGDQGRNLCIASHRRGRDGH